MYPHALIAGDLTNVRTLLFFSINKFRGCLTFWQRELARRSQPRAGVSPQPQRGPQSPPLSGLALVSLRANFGRASSFVEEGVKLACFLIMQTINNCCLGNLSYLSSEFVVWEVTNTIVFMFGSFFAVIGWQRKEFILTQVLTLTETLQ
jgi:hypothetical protein